MRRFHLPTVLAVLLASSPAGSQWINQPTAGLPRDSGGRPNLDAPSPAFPDGTPDLSGLWTQQLAPAYLANIAADLPSGAVSATAATLFQQRMNEFGKDDPGTIGCQPLGPRHITGGGTATLVKIVQTPTLIVMLYEDLAHRQIHMDGRTLPTDPNPSFMGYSVGRWEKETLVVESTGFDNRTWLDFGGHPHGERLRTIERFRRVSVGQIEREITLIDPDFYTQPIVIRAPMRLQADTEMLEYVCADNPRSRPHLVGRTEQERQIVVPVDVLKRYVGRYEAVGQVDLGITAFTVSLDNGVLMIELNGRGRLPMVPLSATMFSPRLLGTYEFMTDAAGNVTSVIAHAAEGAFRFSRRN